MLRIHCLQLRRKLSDSAMEAQLHERPLYRRCVGLEGAARMPDDSISCGTPPTYIQTTLLSTPAVGYDAPDPIAIVFLDPEVSYTRSESPHKTLADVIALRRRCGAGQRRDGRGNAARRRRTSSALPAARCSSILRPCRKLSAPGAFSVESCECGVAEGATMGRSA
jgi:hypothetical protein